MDVSTPTPGPADHGGFAAGEDAPGPLVAALVRGAPKAIRAPLASSLTRAASARAGKLVTCMLVGGWLALFFAGLLGGLDVAVAGSVAAQCLLMVLLGIATWDLVVRWGLIKRGRRLTVAPQTRPAWLLHYFYPWLVLLAGVAFGHFVWR